jgi:hypothetical protein
MSRKREEFMADFCLIANSVLNEAENRVLRYYFLLGAELETLNSPVEH